MKKLVLFLFLITLSFSVNYGQTNATLPSGSGTEADPYQIATLGNLSWLTQTDTISQAYKYYTQNADINAAETATWDDSDDNGDGDRYNDPNDLTSDGNNDGWLPLGTAARDSISAASFFTGNYNGNNHTIDGLSIINRASFNPIGYGFIRIADSVTVKNLGLTNINFNGNSYAGGIAAKAQALVVKKCFVTGTINQIGAGEIIGGLVGRVLGRVFIVEDSYTDVEINTDDISYVAGFVCYIDEASEGSYITRSYSLGNITGDSTYTVAGFIAKHEAPNCIISECYNTGNVVAGKRIGGFIAMNKDAIIKDCYNIGNVTVHSTDKLQEAGVFCGYNKKVSIENSYAVGKIIFDNGLDTTITDRGFVGRQYAKPGKTSALGIACFFDSTISNQNADSFAVPTNTVAMMTENTFTDSGWNFTDVWKVTNNYPNLIQNVNPNLEPLPVTGATQPAGAGTEADPYQIATLGNLSWLTQNYAAWNSHFIQTADIDISETATWDYNDDNGDGDRYNDRNDISDDGENEGWLPIGGEFQGVYNGDGHTISGLTINKATGHLGFFNTIKLSTVKNLGLINININGPDYIGGLTGTCYGNLIENCYATGIITSDSTHSRIGGLVGYISGKTVDATITNSYANVKIIDAQKYVGGFIGNIKQPASATITDCYSKGDIINGTESVGGFIGKIEKSDKILINECYSTGNVGGDKYSGGFVGYSKDGPIISNSYSLGNIIQPANGESSYIGGFCGYNKGAVIENSYSIGSIAFILPDTTIVRNGFTGKQKGTIKACFFDAEVSNQDSSSSAIAKTTSEMMSETTFSDSSWDVASVWTVDFNYPNLKNNLNTDLEPMPVITSTEPAGVGTEADPYQIATLGNLSWLTQNYSAWNKFYLQVADIDAKFTKYWDDADDNGDGDKYNDPNDLTTVGTNDGWLPIELFNGSYNGDEKVIDSLTINRSAVTSGLGFFKQISGGTIENLGLTNVNIKGSILIGALAATCKQNTVKNCYTTGTMTLTTTEKSYKYGGMFANIVSGISEISNCYSEVNIIGTPLSYYIGGFVGNIKGVPAGSISDCYTTGNITNAGQSCGGFVGKNENEEFILDKCYSTGNISSTERSGGFVGYNKSKAVISNCYSLGNVTCISEKEVEFGGFCGYNNSAEIKNSYSIGSVVFTNVTDSTDTTGVGFAGRNKNGTITACFFDKTVSNQDSSAVALGKTTVEMLNASTFKDAGWDFINVWEQTGRRKYPTLRKATVGVEDNKQEVIPTSYSLEQNYPNPFNPTTVIDFALPKATNVTLFVYNILGEKVTELINGKIVAGHHTVNFNATNLASGIYIYRLSADNYIATKKMMLLK